MVVWFELRTEDLLLAKVSPLTCALRFRVSSECAGKPQLKLPTNTPRHEAKTRLTEWAVEVETVGSANDGDYQELRREFMGQADTAPLVPQFVRTCRTRYVLGLD